MIRLRLSSGPSTLVADATEIASITASNGPVVVSTSTFLVDQSTLDQIVGAFDISDAAAVITANLDLLNDPNIDAITISDSGQVGASVQQLATDATTIGELRRLSSPCCSRSRIAREILRRLVDAGRRYGRDRLDHRV